MTLVKCLSLTRCSNSDEYPTDLIGHALKFLWTSQNVFLSLIWLISVISFSDGCPAADIVEGKGSVRIEGEFVNGDYAKFEHIISTRETTNYPVRGVQFMSPGGDIITALSIGRLIRKKWIVTSILGFNFDTGVCVITDPNSGKMSRYGFPCTCDSACFLAWAGGIQRYSSGGNVGLHRPYFGKMSGSDLARPEIGEAYQGITDLVRKYLREMNVPDRYFDLMMSKNSREIYRLSDSEARAIEFAPLAEEAILTTCGAVAEHDPRYEALLRKEATNAFPGAMLDPLSPADQKMMNYFKAVAICERDVIHRAQDKIQH